MVARREDGRSRARPLRTTTAAADGTPPRRRRATEHRSSRKLAEDIELIGEYEGSGFKEAPYIVRRADGQIIQLPPLLYTVAEQIDGTAHDAEIASAVARASKRGVNGDDVE